MTDASDDEGWYEEGDAMPVTIADLHEIDHRLMRNLGRIARTAGVPVEHIDAFYTAAMSTVLVLADEMRIEAENSGPSQAAVLRGLAGRYEAIPARIHSVDQALYRAKQAEQGRT